MRPPRRGTTEGQSRKARSRPDKIGGGPMIPARGRLPVLGVVALVLVASASPGVRGQAPKPAEGARPAPGAVEIRFTDGTSQKLTLLDPKIEFTTPYGKLSVPAADVQRLDCATRIPEDVARQVEKAVADLGSPDFKAREAATAELLRLGARAYPAVLEASRSDDPEVKRRATAVLEKVRQSGPPDMLKVRKNDVLTAGGSTIAGRLDAGSLRVSTAEGREKEVKLADVRGLRSLTANAPPAEAIDVRPDPGTPRALAGPPGTAFYFRVTGAAGGSLWGSDVYTSDSTIAKAAVHAGVLKVGETGVVKVTLVAPPPTFQGGTRNGVTSSPYGAYPGAYTVEKVDPDN